MNKQKGISELFIEVSHKPQKGGERNRVDLCVEMIVPEVSAVKEKLVPVSLCAVAVSQAQGIILHAAGPVWVYFPQ